MSALREVGNVPHPTEIPPTQPEHLRMMEVIRNSTSDEIRQARSMIVIDQAIKGETSESSALTRLEQFDLVVGEALSTMTVEQKRKMEAGESNKPKFNMPESQERTPSIGTIPKGSEKRKELKL